MSGATYTLGAKEQQLTKRRLHITFIDKDGDEIKCEVAEGDNLLDIALEHDVEMEGKHWRIPTIELQANDN